jgi:hypothetical protein
LLIVVVVAIAAIVKSTMVFWLLVAIVPVFIVSVSHVEKFY